LTPHRRDREILEDNAEHKGENVVAGVFSSQGDAGNREAQRKYGELGDHVATAVSHAGAMT
jgi:hypothetical protein